MVEALRARGKLPGHLDGVYIGVLDTERDSAKLYSHLVPFDTLVLDQSPTNIDNIACSLADHDAVLWQNVPHLRRELTRLDGPGGFFPERAHALTAGIVMQAITETEKRSYNVLSSPRRLAAATSYLTETYA
jgi:hypothetical protein